MLGRELEALAPSSRRAPAARTPCCASRGLTCPAACEASTSTSGAGEVVGLAGLVGAGRSDLLGALFGLEPRRPGIVEVDGRAGRAARPRAGDGGRLRRSCPADRKAHGLVLDMTRRARTC